MAGLLAETIGVPEADQSSESSNSNGSSITSGLSSSNRSPRRQPCALLHPDLRTTTKLAQEECIKASMGQWNIARNRINVSCCTYHELAEAALDTAKRLKNKSCVHTVGRPAGQGQCRRCGILECLDEDDTDTNMFCWICEEWTINRLQDLFSL